MRVGFFSLSKYILFALVNVVLVTSELQADDDYQDCMNHAVSYPEKGQCGNGLLKREDTKLNAAWERVVSHLPSENLDTLTEDQTIWRQYREAACGFYQTAPFPKDDQGVEYYACKVRITSDRTIELEHIDKLLLTFR